MSDIELRWKLEKNGLRTLRALHRLFAGVRVGGLVGILWLLLEGGATPEPCTFGADRVLYELGTTFLWFAFAGTLITSLLFALFTTWGFFLHRWIVVLLLLALTLGWSTPALHGILALSGLGLPAHRVFAYVQLRQEALIAMATQLLIVIAVFLISAIKPCGRRTLRRRANQPTVALIVAGIAIASGPFGLWNQSMLDRLRALPREALAARGLADGRYAGHYVCDIDYAVVLDVAGG